MVEQATFNREVPGSSPGGPTIAPEEREAPGVRRPPVVLWGIGLIACATALILLVGLVIARRPFQFDPDILLSLRTAGDLARPIGPDWLHRAMIDITALGGGTVLTLVVVAVVVLMIARKLWWRAALVAVATLSGSQLVAVLKDYVGRPRPELVDHLVQASGLSFPSGHAANSAIVYLTIALLASQVARGRAVRTTLIVLAALLVTAIGASRVYLGVHWPSDVLAGWSFGSLWALGWWWIGARIRPGVR